MPSIVAAIKERERQRQRAQQELAALDQFEDLRALDVGEVERVLGAKLFDWRDLLCRNIAEARQALRSLVPERLKFTPKDENGERFSAFEGTAVLDRLLSGVALPKALVAPTSPVGARPVISTRVSRSHGHTSGSAASATQAWSISA